jgi:hypothetical protein
MKFDGLYHIRDAVSEDRNFVIHSFLESLYYGNKAEPKCTRCGEKQHTVNWITRIPMKIFYDNYKIMAQSLFDSVKNKVKIACLPDDPNVIIGYSIVSQDLSTLHYVYVKKVWRRRGIAKSLCALTPLQVSHLTNQGEKLLTKFSTEVLFNPFVGAL